MANFTKTYLATALVLVLSLWVTSGSTNEDIRFKNPAGQLPNLEFGEDIYSGSSSTTGGGGTALTPPDATLLASTIDGTLVAIDQASGEVIWQLNDQPVVNSPYDSNKPILPAFLPDPKDGSIYMIGGGLKEPLKKLPFTIPELVAASPCKSSDGILYTGKKVDTWFSVDRFTGSKKGSLSFGGCFESGDDNTCPKPDPSNFLIGRTEYNIMMYDSRAEGRKWNISFYDYSSNLGGVEVGPEYNFAHFTDSSLGLLVTLDRLSGVVLWKISIGSPIVALYRVEGEGIVNIPFTSVSKETLNNLLEQFNAPETNNEIIGETKLYQTLYVGEHEHGLYAMPSLVDEQTLTISPTSNGPLLLEGPQNFQVPAEINLDIISDGQASIHHSGSLDPFGIPLEPGQPYEGRESVLLFGYYQVPEYSTIKLSPAVTQLQLTSGSQSGLTFRNPPSRVISPFFQAMPPPELMSDYMSTPRKNLTEIDEKEVEQEELGYNASLISRGFDSIKTMNSTFLLSTEFFSFVGELWPLLKETVGPIENKELKVIALLLAVGVFILIRIFQQNMTTGGLYGSFRMSSSSVGSTSSHAGTHYEVTATPVELDNGIVKVGNIFFDPGHILGKGCEGTFVYKGRFDNRDVAVKRVLAACFSIADREVDLLRESDEHPNVVRYFCMEQDRQFRYIALEYCCATLQDYVDGRYINTTLDAMTILRQATQGVQHLHNLDIVHRDIKPHNVLISMPGKKGEVRAMISDFGLCKKLKVGRMSFSRRSGIAGTEGWIAPEMMLGNRSTTCAVDVFSLGCVYYFVLTNGSHPFGESFRRQANILTGEFCLDKMFDERWSTARALIEKMISVEHTHRPTTTAVLRHPMFWPSEKVLNFLQDVSDRVDKESFDSAIVASLERNKLEVVRNNWYDLLDVQVAEDLRRHRTYNGKSVRDLLRALRNKKHHYQELHHSIKALYGRMPDQYAEYWIKRFPKLLIHTWYTMHAVKREPALVKYFDKDYDFVLTLPKRSFANPVQRNDQELFLPHFANGRRLIDNNLAGGQKFDNEDSNFSQESVISSWDNLSSGIPDDEFQDMSSSESNGHEPFELTAAELSPIEKPSPLPAKLPLPVRKKSLDDVPALLPMQRHFGGDTPFEETHKAAKKMVSIVSPPKIRQNVAQLNSQNREAHQQKVAQLSKPSSWAEAVQNLQPKAATIVSKAVEPKLTFEHKHTEPKSVFEPKHVEQKLIFEHNVVVAENGNKFVKQSDDCEMKSDLSENVKNCDKENVCAHKEDDNKIEEKDGIDESDRNLSENGPVWILPPADDEEAKKKKKNKKNKKKVAKI